MFTANFSSLGGGRRLCAAWSLLLTACLTALTASAKPPEPQIVTLYQGATDSAVALGITPIGVVDAWLEKPMYRYLRAPWRRSPMWVWRLSPTWKKLPG